MSRTLNLQIDDDLYRLLSTAAGAEERSIVSFIDTAIRERIRALPLAEPAAGEAGGRFSSERRRTLERLFELFEGHDAEAEIRRLKEQDAGF